MSRQARTLCGMLGLMLGLLLYVGAIGWLAAWIGPMPLVLEISFYACFGIAWIFPARPVLKWIGRASAGPV